MSENYFTYFVIEIQLIRFAFSIDCIRCSAKLKIQNILMYSDFGCCIRFKIADGNVGQMKKTAEQKQLIKFTLNSNWYRSKYIVLVFNFF